MKRTMLLGAMLSAALATGLSAQTPQSGARSSDQSSGNQVTMTGCLKAGDSSSSTGGTTSRERRKSHGECRRKAAGSGFILTDAMAGPGSKKHWRNGRGW